MLSGGGKAAAVQKGSLPKPQKMGEHGSLEFLFKKRGVGGSKREVEDRPHTRVHPRGGSRSEGKQTSHKGLEDAEHLHPRWEQAGPSCPQASGLVAQQEAGVLGGAPVAEL